MLRILHILRMNVFGNGNEMNDSNVKISVAKIVIASYI
jgi:hypothetical protein